jgi:hypothetical protein
MNLIDPRDLLPNQYQKPRIQALLDIHTERWQGLADMAANVMQLMDIDVMIGKQLDFIGEIVGISRYDFSAVLSDADFRTALNLQIRLNHSAGEPENLIAGLQDYTGASKVNYRPLFPSEVWLEYIGGTTPDGLYQMVLKLLAGGIGLTLVHSEVDTFTFDSDAYGFDNGNLGTLIV